MGLILADTNFIIYMLEGDDTLAQLFDDNKVAISFITELELLTAKQYSPAQSTLINITIEKCLIYHYDNFIKNSCISLRQNII